MKCLMPAKWRQMITWKIYSCFILQVVANAEGARTCKPQNNGVESPFNTNTKTSSVRHQHQIEHKHKQSNDMTIEINLEGKICALWACQELKNISTRTGWVDIFALKMEFPYHWMNINQVSTQIERKCSLSYGCIPFALWWSKQCLKSA